MIEFGFSKLALIGVVALLVIGPEKLPRVARTVGHLFGKAQRYVADVKAEVSRSIELDELRKMKSSFEDAARDVESQISRGVEETTRDFDSAWRDATDGLGTSSSSSASSLAGPDGPLPIPPSYSARMPVRKNWRIKRAAMPHWYKQRHGVRTSALSGAARVARFRPRSSPKARS